MADDIGPISFPRTPYTVTYQDLQGKLQSIRRLPPPKLHDILPTDVVELTHKKNDDFAAGDQYTVKNISPRQPNTLQIVNSQGDTTFVDYFDVNLLGELSPSKLNAEVSSDQPNLRLSNRYLMWP